MGIPFKNKHRVIIVILLIFIALTTLYNVTIEGIQTNYVNNKLVEERGFDKEQYNYALPSIKNEEFIRLSKLIMEGKLRVHENIESYIGFEDPNDINWDAIVGESPNTYQLYLQCLNPIILLSRTFELTGDDQYIQMAKQIIISWMDYKESEPQNTFLWYDHGTALRLENIIYFMLVLEEREYIDESFNDKINELIKEHISYLSNDSKYTHNHNHGIFQDRALIYGAYFQGVEENKYYVELAKERLVKQIDFAFNSEMVHVENSPGYQVGVVQILYQISDFLEQFQDEWGIELKNKVKKSNDFLMHILKPNGSLAEVGDTIGSIENRPSNLGYRFDNQELLYSSTWGNEGIKPVETTAIYPQAGYYIGRNSWEKDTFNDSTWVMFRSGYSSKTHKHADDLSFMLYSKGKDIFVDPGWYNYVIGDIYRDYLLSSNAHNTIIVDSKSYSVTEQNSYKTGILTYEFSDNYDYVLGFNKMYEGVQIDRHFYYLKDDAIVLYDDIISEDIHEYSQLFHTSEYMKLLEAKDDEVLLSIEGTPYNVRVKQLGGNTKLLVHRQVGEGIPYGHISRVMNKVEPIYTLEFKQEGSHTQYITIITIEDKYGNNNSIKSYNYTKIEGIVIDNGEEEYAIHFKGRERIDASSVEVINIEGNKYEFISKQPNQEGLQYAWYIVDESNGEVLERVGYSSENALIYDFQKGKNYLVKAYVKNQFGERDFAIVGKISYVGDTAINNSENLKDGRLILKEHYYEKLGDNKYKFVIPYEYFWDISVKWYIYRNGGYYTVINGQNILEYQFTEPGSYTVMYYFKTLNGDMEFWNFKAINID
jgi:hypothetical protein